MKTKSAQSACRKPRRRHGFLQIDLVVALAIFSIAIVPLGFSFSRERQVLKMDYRRSVVNEIVDGEMEILAAGAGRDFPDGSHIYPFHSRAAASLPPGYFQLTKSGNHLRLEWRPDEPHSVGVVTRETTMP
jgi:hypothetical protein